MTEPRIPDAVAIDANGYWWRVWGEDPNWSMVPTNPDNVPIPQPVALYRLVPFRPGVHLRVVPTEPERPMMSGRWPARQGEATHCLTDDPPECHHDICDGEPECLLPAEPEDGARD